MASADRPEERAPGAADEGTPGAEAEPGVGQEPEEDVPVAGGAATDVGDAAEDAPSQIDIEEIRPEIDKEQRETDTS